MTRTPAGISRWFLIVIGLCWWTVPVQSQPVADGLTLWLAADAGVTTDDAGGVVSWLDLSGNGHDAGQTEPTQRPLWVDGVLNGNPVLSFSGQGDFLNLSGQVLTSQQFTIIAVVSDTRDSSDNSFREVFSNWTFQNMVTSVFFGTVKGDPVRARLTDNFGGADPPYDQQGVGMIVHPDRHFTFTGVSGAADAVIYRNAHPVASKGGPLTARNLTTPYVVGTQGNINREYWQGDIAELLVYDRELTGDELRQDWKYLHRKYFRGR